MNYYRGSVIAEEIDPSRSMKEINTAVIASATRCNF